MTEDGAWRLLDARWHGTELRVTAADSDRRVQELPLQGSFRWRVGADRTCTGEVRGGMHAPCRFRSTPLPPFSQCSQCLSMPSPGCVLEPRGQNQPGHRCPLCARPHVVYLALHGTLPKIGMTSGRRLEARLYEQGADAWFRIGETSDRAGARRLEKQVSALHGIPEWRRHHEILPQWVRPLDRPGIKEKAEALQARLARHHDVEQELHWVPTAPLRRPVAERPVLRPPAGHHSGTWLGAKGNYVVYAPTSDRERLDVGRHPVFVLKRGDLAGRSLILGDD